MGAVTSKVLVLGGTAEARRLATVLEGESILFMSSLAGRVSRPRLPVGPVRIGGFGGATGLAEYLRDEGFTHLVVATHPFAGRMALNAQTAALAAGVSAVRLVRPGWGVHPNAPRWTWVDDFDGARDAAAVRGTRPFLTTGRQTLHHFAPWSGRSVLVRVVEPLEVTPPGWSVVLDRGPYEVAGERALMERHHVDVLVTKDSGGRYTEAKLTAAHQLAVPVVVVRRPPAPRGMREVDSAIDVIRWVDGES